MAPSLSSLRVSPPGFPLSVKACFGGNGLRSNPKEARPFSSRVPQHFVLGLRPDLARVLRAWFRRERSIARLYREQADRCGVRLLRFSVAREGIHLVLRARRRADLQKFLRSTAGLLARRLLGAERGRPARDAGGIWRGRPFSRLLTKSWARGAVGAELPFGNLRASGSGPERSRVRGRLDAFGKWICGVTVEGPGAWKRLVTA